MGSPVDADGVPVAHGTGLEKEWKVLLPSYSIQNLLPTVCYQVRIISSVNVISNESFICLTTFVYCYYFVLQHVQQM